MLSTLELGPAIRFRRCFTEWFSGTFSAPFSSTLFTIQMNFLPSTGLLLPAIGTLLAHYTSEARWSNIGRGRSRLFGRQSRISNNPSVDELGFLIICNSQPAEIESPVLIALHSLCALLETGLRMSPREKSQEVTTFEAEQSVLRSPVCLRIIANTGIVRVFRRKASEISLQSRLRGGAERIRTLGTVCNL